MLLSNAFAGYHLEFKLLAYAQLHDGDWVQRLAGLVVHELYRCHLQLLPPVVYVVRRDLVATATSGHIQVKDDRALGATTRLTVAQVAEIKVVDIVGDERDEAAAVSNELVMKCRGVLADLHDVDCHRRHFGDDDAAECVCHSQVSVVQLELDGIEVFVENLDLWLQMHLFIHQEGVADVSSILAGCSHRLTIVEALVIVVLVGGIDLVWTAHHGTVIGAIGTLHAATHALEWRLLVVAHIVKTLIIVHLWL